MDEWQIADLLIDRLNRHGFSASWTHAASGHAYEGVCRFGEAFRLLVAGEEFEGVGPLVVEEAGDAPEDAEGFDGAGSDGSAHVG